MRAALVRQLGGPEVVEVAEVDAPAPGPGEVRVRVRAASVNFPDVLLVAGRYQVPVEPPFVPGSELAGEVVELGEGVTDLATGDLVFGSTLVGAFAEEAVVGRTALTLVPEGVDLGVAAAFGVAHRTAFHVLRSVAALEAGERLVVLGAGGGVGLAAVQLGRALGAEVVAVASSTEKLVAAEAAGASTLVDRTAGPLRGQLKAAVPGGADVVVDPVGGDQSEAALRSLRYGGRFVTVGYASGEIPRIPLNLVLLKGVAVLGFQFVDFAAHRPAERERDEAALLDLLATGRAVPHVGTRFSLDDVVDALRLVADGRAVGKVLVDIGATGAAAGRALPTDG